MATEGGFFSPSGSSFSTNQSGDAKVAGFFSKKKEIPTRKFKGIKGRTAEIDAINSQTYRDMGDESMADTFKEKYNIDPRDYLNLQSKRFVSPSGDEVGQIASATTDLGGMLAANNTTDDSDFQNYMKVLGIKRPGQLPSMMIRMLKENYQDDKRDLRYKDGQLFNKAPEKNIFQKVGDFLTNTLTGSQPVAAGTLDANQQVAQVSERPKLSYVNPDAKTMSLSEIKDAFKPKNLFGYKDKFGRFDDPGSPLAMDRAQTIQRVAQNFTSPIVGDARTIGQIRADQEARMRENARLRNESFQRGERVKQKSADVTYGTNMLSNPAFGFRDKMTDAAKAQYDQSARDATEMARTDPSLGNVIAQTVNRVTGLVGGPQMSLEKIGERQLRLANKEINRPTYQKEAYARNFLGITNDQLRARNMQQIQANAAARNQAFQNEKVQRALEKSALRKGETSGQSMPSNPKGFSGYSRKSSPSTGTGTGTSTSRSRPGSKKTSRGSSPGSRSRGGTGTGGSKAKASGSRGQGGGTASRSKGGSFGGARRSANTSKSRRRCDIRTKINISSLINQNLIKDDLATVAYFVQELREK